MTPLNIGLRIAAKFREVSLCKTTGPQSSLAALAVDVLLPAREVWLPAQPCSPPAVVASSSSSTSGGGDSTKKSGVVMDPTDTTKQAKKGGVLKDRNFGDPPSLDVIQATVSWNPFGFGVYSSLVQPAPGYKVPAGEDLLPDIAESWETSPDGLTITMKIRQNVKWHNKAPVNGRAFDIGRHRCQLEPLRRQGQRPRRHRQLSVDPSAPVLSLTATDAKTVVIKLKEPLVYALAALRLVRQLHRRRRDHAQGDGRAFDPRRT